MANIVCCADGTWNRPEEDIEKDYVPQKGTSTVQTEEQEQKSARKSTQEAEAGHVDAQEGSEQEDKQQEEEGDNQV